MKDGEMRYFFLRDEKKFPVACVASVYHKESDELRYAISTHNPKDKFDRKEAKNYASGRIEGKAAVIRDVGNKKNIKWQIMYDLAIENYKMYVKMKKDWRNEIPTRTRTAAKLWLEEFQKRYEEKMKKEAEQKRTEFKEVNSRIRQETEEDKKESA